MIIRWVVPDVMQVTKQLQFVNRKLHLGLNGYRLRRLYQSGQVIDVKPNALSKIDNIPHIKTITYQMVKNLIKNNKQDLKTIHDTLMSKSWGTPIIVQQISGRWTIASSILLFMIYIIFKINIKCILLTDYEKNESTPFQL